MTTNVTGKRYSTAIQDYMHIRKLILDCTSGPLGAGTEFALGPGGARHAICLQDTHSCLKYRAGDGISVWINDRVAGQMGVLLDGQKMSTEVDGKRMLTAEFNTRGRRK